VNPSGPPYMPHSSGSPMKTALVAGAIVALVAANVYLYIQLDHVRAELATAQDKILTEITNLREASTVSSASARRHMDTLRDELDTTKRQATQAASQAKSEAVTRAEQLAARLSAEQRKQEQQVTSQLSEVKQTATSAHTKIGEVSGDVSNVRTEVASTKSELEHAVADLKRVRGELGEHGSLIATNGKELAVLRRLGERDFIEFRLNKTKQPQRIGDVSIILKKADQKRNRFTIELYADDKRTEKKDRTTNEPIQFYVSKARQPYELVVNEVQKDLIVGYLSSPKDQVSRN
jgi:chromosome segregation ATPase